MGNPLKIACSVILPAIVDMVNTRAITFVGYKRSRHKSVHSKGMPPAGIIHDIDVKVPILATPGLHHTLPDV